MRVLIPKPRSVAPYIAILVVIFFSWMAIQNLRNGVATIASTIWLAIVGFVILISSQGGGGYRRLFIELLGKLSEQHFAEVNSDRIDFGFRLSHRRFVYQSITLDEIESIEWSTGQATYIAGRDMGDWSVYLWFNPHVNTKRRKQEQDVYVVGEAGPREKTEVFGLAFVELLRKSGAKFVPTPDPNRFARSTDIAEIL